MRGHREALQNYGQSKEAPRNRREARRSRASGSSGTHASSQGNGQSKASGSRSGFEPVLRDYWVTSNATWSRSVRGRIYRPVFPRSGFRVEPKGQLLPFCSQIIPKQPEMGTTTRQHEVTNNSRPFRRFSVRSEGYRPDPSRAHNPKVAGSNPAPATK